MKKMIQPEALKVGANRISANDARSVKLDFAPMEGITGYVFRQAHAVIYGGVDRYYSPFIAPGSSHKLTSRERNDILPEHNQGLCLIPQILTHSAEDFLWVCEELAEYGYRTVNLNLGCPSGTVVTKKKGAGFLAEPEDLSLFLEEVCNGLEKIHGLATAPRPNISAANFIFFCVSPLSNASSCPTISSISADASAAEKRFPL